MRRDVRELTSPDMMHVVAMHKALEQLIKAGYRNRTIELEE